ncbi:MAG: GIDE domain-containing protein [Armatimonadota bacterium]
MAEPVFSEIFEAGMSQTHIIIGTISLICGCVLVYYYIRAKRIIDEMWAVKSYTARDLRLMCSSGFQAIVKVEGIIECADPLISPAAKTPCCWYHLKIEWEEPNDENEGRHLVTYEETKSTIFKVCDETGFTLVDPTGSEIETVEDYFDTVNRYTAREITHGIGLSDNGEYHVTEEILHDGGYAYVLGMANCIQKGTSSDVMISKPYHGYIDRKAHFIISRKGEKEMTRQYGISVSVCYYLAAISFVMALFSIFCLLRQVIQKS